jgi:hypothetical protein
VSLKQASLASATFWKQHGISIEFLNQFWTNLWFKKLPRKLILFQWLVINRASAVGTWLSKAGHNPRCLLCGDNQETQYHCLMGLCSGAINLSKGYTIVRVSTSTWYDIMGVRDLELLLL